MCVMIRALPIGVQDFKEVRDSDYLYVDKSDMISQILSEGAKVYLYTRPRRFGKSLNLSMLDAFFNIKYPKDNRWFDGLKVSECNECQEHKNAYPVIYFDFKELGVANIDTFNSDLVDGMSDLYRTHKYLLDSDSIDEVDRSYFMDVISRRMNPIKLRKSISTLSRMLYEHHGKKVIVLFDEYDNPLLNAYSKEFHKDIIQFMRDIMTSVFKGNESLMFGIITGVTQIAKESIFSGINNLKVNNIFSSKFDEMFGFTNDEVKSICEEYGRPDKYEEAKEWYDGYRFGDTEVYNPWSVLNYVDEGFRPQAYWAGTSGNSIIDTLLDYSDEKVFEELLKLSQGETIEKTVDPTITFEDINGNPNNVYSIMVMSGYLNAVPIGRRHHISLPNGEMYQVFGDLLAKYVSRRYGDNDTISKVRRFSDAIVDNDPEELEKALYDLFASTLSTKILDHEHAYQSAMAMLLMNLHGKYRVRLEFENGKGFMDIIMEPKVPLLPNIVIELKRLKSEESVDRLIPEAKIALEQIHDRDYIFGMKGRIFLYGIAFKGMEAKVLSETLSR